MLWKAYLWVRSGWRFFHVHLTVKNRFSFRKHFKLLVPNDTSESKRLNETWGRNCWAKCRLPLKHLENYEKALETVLNLNLFMLLKQFEFNHDYIYYDFEEMSSLFNIMRVAINLMSYLHNQNLETIREFKSGSAGGSTSSSTIPIGEVPTISPP